tara:strand:- start:87 stop:740 length:654 start_codon:yes stop_codon:yes gene_type:complete
MELCGGTHVENTGDIGYFHIIEESSLASGIRRIVAVTGYESISKVQANNSIVDELKNLLNTNSDQLLDRVKRLLSERKSMEKELKNRPSDSGIDFSYLLEKIENVNDFQIIVEKIETKSMDELKRFGDNIRGKLQSGIGVIFMDVDRKSSAVIVVSDNIITLGYTANDLAKSIGEIMGGGGGGKPHLATAGGSDNVSFEKVMKKTKKMIINILTELK